MYPVSVCVRWVYELAVSKRVTGVPSFFAGAKIPFLFECGRREPVGSIRGVRIHQMQKKAASALYTGYTIICNGIHSVRKKDLLT